MKEIHEILEEEFPQEHRECLIQQETMAEEDREAFLARFRGNRGVDFDNVIQMEVEIEETEETEDAEDTVDTLVGFCVLGGIFGEGIDLKNDRTIYEEKAQNADELYKNKFNAARVYAELVDYIERVKEK